MINNFLQRYDLMLAQSFWLWLLLLIPIYFVFRKQWKKNRHSYWQLSNLPLDFSSEVPAKIRWRPLMQVLRVLAFIGIILALARPQQTDKATNIDAEGIDIMLTIDISGSMMDKDFEPNRLEATKRTMEQFVKERRGDRMGLVIFAGESFTQCPITLDHKILLEQIGVLRSDMLAMGTSIGNGLASSVGGLRNTDGKSKVILLMTDGVNQIGAPNTLSIDPYDAIEMAKLYNIKVYTIGIGSKGIVMRPTPQPDGSIADVPTQTDLDEVLLGKIASETGGAYYRATDNSSLKQIYNEIDKLEKSKVEMSTSFQYKDVFYWFLIPALCFLILEMVLRYTYFKTITEE